ncbi:hypothetical protein [Methanosarcina spelaei]|uniref:hypothetical protein n=1 Tax=Methanosarcina spelaei TaxID=1036679 RepID=UPI0014834E2F|nr:hypothetical protein [Methanosarcina spelaei]
MNTTEFCVAVVAGDTCLKGAKVRIRLLIAWITLKWKTMNNQEEKFMNAGLKSRN